MAGADSSRTRHDAAVTLADVAAVAGVSVSTVSKVLSGKGRASEATRRTVLAAAERLDYRPNALAQSFARGKSQVIAVITMEGQGHFTAPMVIGITRALGRSDFATLVYDAHHDARVLDDHVRTLRSRRVDGVIVVGDRLTDRVRSITRTLGVPVAYASCLTDVPDDATFLADYAGASGAITRHLLEQGRRRILHLTHRSDFGAQERLQGFLDTLAGEGLEPAAAPMLGTWLSSWGQQATRRALADGTRFDAVFAGNDQIAVGAIQALTEAGHDVPQDVAVAGFDFVLENTPFEHTLTTFDPAWAAFGESVAGALVTALERGEDLPAGSQHLPGRLVPGYSTTGVLPRDVLTLQDLVRTPKDLTLDG